MRHLRVAAALLAGLAAALLAGLVAVLATAPHRLGEGPVRYTAPMFPGSDNAVPAGTRVALVHHWLVRRRGGERVLEALSRALPGADLFTLVHDPERCPAPREVARVITSRLGRIPFGRQTFRAWLPLFPKLYGELDLSGHDLVVSSDASVAKAVTVPEGVPHLCYCYSPVRYAWDLREVYLERGVPAPLRPLARGVLEGLRKADAEAAGRVDRFVAISAHVADRIRRAYGRDCSIVAPPVDIAFFTPGEEHPDGPTRAGEDRPYLLLGEAVPYKRFDLAVEACRRLDRPLVVAGGGPEFRRLAGLAGPRTRFVRDPTDEQVREFYRSCRALLFPGEEDFGLVPVEAMACGRPVVAFGLGGAAETVIDGETGVLYGGEGAEGLITGIERFEREQASLRASACVRRAANYGPAAFQAGLRRALAEVLSDRTGTPSSRSGRPSQGLPDSSADPAATS